MNPPATAATSPLLSLPQHRSRPNCQPAAVAQRLDGVCRRYRLLVVAITALCLVTGAAPELLTAEMTRHPPLPGAEALHTLAALAAIVAVTIATPGPGRGRRRPSSASLPRSSHGPDREWD